MTAHPTIMERDHGAHVAPDMNKDTNIKCQPVQYWLYRHQIHRSNAHYWTKIPTSGFKGYCYMMTVHIFFLYVVYGDVQVGLQLHAFLISARMELSDQLQAPTALSPRHIA
jgi:hypothetical protein